jgi:hypothetical protein
MSQQLQVVLANERECRMLAATSLTDEARKIFKEMAESYETLANIDCCLLHNTPSAFRHGKK